MTARLRCPQTGPDPLNMEPRMEPRRAAPDLQPDSWAPRQGWASLASALNPNESAEQAAPLPAGPLHSALGQQLGPRKADADLRIYRPQRPFVQVTAEVTVDIWCAEVHRALAFVGREMALPI